MKNNRDDDQANYEEKERKQRFLVGKVEQMLGKRFCRHYGVNEHGDAACDQSKQAHNVKGQNERYGERGSQKPEVRVHGRSIRRQEIIADCELPPRSKHRHDDDYDCGYAAS